MKRSKFINLILIIASTLPISHAYAGKPDNSQNCSETLSTEQSRISSDLQQALQSARANRRFTAYLLVPAKKIDSVIAQIDQMGNLSGSVKQPHKAWAELEVRGTKKALLTLLNSKTEVTWAGPQPIAQDESHVKAYLLELREKLYETPGYNMFTLDQVDGVWKTAIYIYEGSELQTFHSLIENLPIPVELKVTNPGYPRQARAYNMSPEELEEVSSSLRALGIKFETFNEAHPGRYVIQIVYETHAQEEAARTKFGKRRFERGSPLSSPPLSREEEQELIDRMLL